jgi:hypothetical protein
MAVRLPVETSQPLDRSLPLLDSGAISEAVNQIPTTGQAAKKKCKEREFLKLAYWKNNRQNKHTPSAKKKKLTKLKLLTVILADLFSNMLVSTILVLYISS